MVNGDSLKTILSQQKTADTIVPLYDTYNFINIPDTLISLLKDEATPKLPASVLGKLPQKYKQVVVFFLDGFGWHFLEQNQHHPFFQNLEKRGVLSQLTSQFPSTTIAHITCMHTGLPLTETGYFEWLLYEPLVNDIIAPIPYTRARVNKPESLLEELKGQQVFPFTTLYERLQKKGITSCAIQPHSFLDSTFSRAMYKGAESIPYLSVPDGLTKLATILESEKYGYHYFYIGDIDKNAHKFGPEAKETQQVITEYLNYLNDFIFGKYATKDRAFVLTADHGHESIIPDETIYINKKAPKIYDYLKTNNEGKPLAPAGACRDMFLYVQEDKVDNVVAYLQQTIGEDVDVYKTTALLQKGLFGEKVSKRFRDRIGNVVLLPKKGKSVWWYEKGLFENPYFGYHGGLSPAEMLIPFMLISGL